MTGILLVEDDESLGATLSERLRLEGYAVSWAKTRQEARQLMQEPGCDLCILDIGLPDGSGLDLARDLHLSRKIPFLFLTAMNSAEYRLEGYELGAEDFIPKPFHLKEFLMRVSRVIERFRAQSTVSYGDVKIDFQQKSLTLPDGSVEFPIARDFDLLKLLIDEAPREVSRSEIVDKLWQGDRLSTARTIDNAVVRLRHAFRKAGGDYIRSVRGVGYQWVAARKN